MSRVLLHQNYEEYLVTNMIKYQKENPDRAMAWMITARSLFPNDFFVQYEAYKLEKQFKNINQASSSLTGLVRKFCNESGFFLEMQNITEALQSKSKDEETSFLKEVFKCLGNDMKYKILMTVANNCKDPMQHCSLMLLLLQELPNQMCQHGEKVIDNLLATEKMSLVGYPTNNYRKLLVCGVTPTILFTPNFRLSPKILYCLLQAAIEFYVYYIFETRGEDSEMDIIQMNPEEPIMKIESLHNGWKSLFILLKTIGQQLQWSLVDLFESRIDLLMDLSWEKIISMVRKKLFNEAGDHGTMLAGGSHESSSHAKEVFFCTTVIFYYSLHQFSQRIGPKFFPKSNSSDLHFILIEGIRSLGDEDSKEPMSKRFKYERDAKKLDKGPIINVSRKASPDLADGLLQSFLMSAKVWELMHCNYSLGGDFAHLYQTIKMEGWPCFQEFYINQLIYRANHTDAITFLNNLLSATNDPFINNKALLQLSSCYISSNRNVDACEFLFNIICSLQSPMGNSHDVQIPTLRSSQHLYFIAYSLDEILHFTIELLLNLYKKKIYITIQDNVFLGHLLILSQYKWPREEELFLRCVHHIRQTGNFCFSKFFDYIIVLAILEEFMFLTTQGGGSVTLDLLPTSTMQVGKQRAVTRGVNKGAKEDLTETMKKQVTRCNESLDELFVQFICQEQRYIKMIIA